jgi:hypothetical protein
VRKVQFFLRPRKERKRRFSGVLNFSWSLAYRYGCPPYSEEKYNFSSGEERRGKGGFQGFLTFHGHWPLGMNVPHIGGG